MFCGTLLSNLLKNLIHYLVGEKKWPLSYKKK